MRGRGGFATLLVLWAVLLLGTLGLSFSLAMRTEAQAARNALEATRAYYAARSGISRAVAMLSAMPPDNVLAKAIEGGDADSGYSVRVLSESGKVDINAVPEGILKEILRKGGLSGEEAERVGDAILDWRDPDDTPRAAGAEAAEYGALPEPIRPRNGRLSTVEELRYVAGVEPEFFDRFLSRVFTANGSGMAVNVNRAPVEVLRAMPGISAEVADEIVARRAESPFATPSELASFLSGRGVGQPQILAFSTFDVAHAYAVESTGRAGEAARRVVSCLLEVGGTAQNPVRMVGWKDQVTEGEE